MKFVDQESGIEVVFPDMDPEDNRKAFKMFCDLVDLTRTKPAIGKDERENLFVNVLKQHNEESEKGMDEFLSALREDNPKGELGPDESVPDDVGIDIAIAKAVEHTSNYVKGILGEIKNILSDTDKK